MSPAKKLFSPNHMIRSLFLFSLLLCFPLAIAAQAPAAGSPSNTGSMAVSPARFELEMKPGTETTVVVNLDYRAPDNIKEPARIVASLSDWTITKDGRVEYFRANTRPDSASSWLIYSPGEASVVPGTIHQIRVTISVPADAAPGDHLTALIIEQRPESLKQSENLRQMIVRYRMASVFYIKVSNLTKKGLIEDLYAESMPDSIVVTPTLMNEGNSMVRPTASVKVLDAKGNVVADVTDIEPLPVLAGAKLSQPVVIDKMLSPGNYTVKYRIDFQDGGKPIEGVTDLIVKPIAAATASVAKSTPRP
jgi:methionine-rich copper-binding protein CopC